MLTGFYSELPESGLYVPFRVAQDAVTATTCSVGGKTVLDGQATILVPSKADKA